MLHFLACARIVKHNFLLIQGIAQALIYKGEQNVVFPRPHAHPK